MATSQGGVRVSVLAGITHLLDELRTYAVQLETKRIPPPKKRTYHGYARHFAQWLIDRSLPSDLDR